MEQGKIIKWRQGEIVGLGSSSVVYSAIRVDANTLLAVKKFKVVSDITGVDQSKLKIIKVSNLNVNMFFRTKYKNTNNYSTKTWLSFMAVSCWTSSFVFT